MNRFCDQLATRVRESLKPPPDLTLSQWADANAYLSPETSASPGKFRSFAYQRGVMDAVTDPTVKTITFIKSARVGYTKILDHVLGYFIQHDPAPVLMVQPRVEDAEDYSRTEVAPMLRDTPVLRAIAGDLARDPNQRIIKRVFRNGASIAFVGANSAAGFRRITARIICFDEVDSYPIEGAGEEGDQIQLGVKRSETFWNRKVILGSTPLLKSTSRIERSWEESDKRRYWVPCPHCGEFQVLKWSNLRWDRSPTGDHLPATAHFVCEASGCVIEESHKRGMIDRGEWRTEQEFKGHAGFHIWAAYSLFPNACWANLADEFLRVRKNPTMLRTFVNTVLGETWEERVERVEGSALLARGENYGPHSLPHKILALTAGVDTQGDRLEMCVIGWGDRDESWLVDYQVLWGDPAQPQVWVDLDKSLIAPYFNDLGNELRIRGACVDSGGHHAAQVVAFCRPRINRRVFPTKGAGGPRPVWPKSPSRTHTNDMVFVIGVDTAKDALYGRLRIESPGPGYVHFPVGGPFDQGYYEQLTSEHVHTRHREGMPYRVWVLPEGRRNEALDTYVLALAARMSLPRLDSMVAPPRAQHVATAGGTVTTAPPPFRNPFPSASPSNGRKPIARMLAR